MSDAVTLANAKHFDFAPGAGLDGQRDWRGSGAVPECRPAVQNKIAIFLTAIVTVKCMIAPGPWSVVPCPAIDRRCIRML